LHQRHCGGDIGIMPIAIQIVCDWRPAGCHASDFALDARRLTAISDLFPCFLGER
jgi:hypothetical protein